MIVTKGMEDLIEEGGVDGAVEVTGVEDVDAGEEVAGGTVETDLEILAGPSAAVEDRQTPAGVERGHGHNNTPECLCVCIRRYLLVSYLFRQ